MRMDNALTTLVGEELEGKCKWSGTLAAPNGSLYGIPSAARRVVKFNLMVCGDHVLPLSMDAFTSCLAWLVES